MTEGSSDVGVEILLHVAIGAIRDILEAEQWPPNSGRALCAVYTYYPKMESPAEYMRAVATGNPGQTIAIVMEQSIKVSWKDFAGYTRKNDFDFQVQIMRPWETGEDKHEDFRRMYEKALNVLNRRNLRQLGTAYSSIRMREWSVTDPSIRTLTNVTSFSAVLTGFMDNQPTLAS